MTKVTTTVANTVMDNLLAKDENEIKPLEVGQMVKGTVISSTKTEMLVDIGGINTGIIRKKELFVDDATELNLNPGDEIEAMVIDPENEIDMVELSLRFAGHAKAWDALSQLRDANTINKARILDANKGGLLVSINGVNGFLPVSQLNPEHYPRVPGGDKNRILEKLKSYVGEDFEVKVLDVDEEQNKLIVSEKAAWEESQKDVLDKHKVGELIEGSVTAVTDFGVFVRFGENLEGLVHISELAWQRIDDPNDLFKVGQSIQAEVINIEGSKIFLSIKKLQKDPWTNIEEKYKIGQMVEGKVIKANPFGLFVELDNEIHGLAHISELSDKPVTDVSTIAKPGDTISFRIVSIEPKEHRLGLSLKPEEKKTEKSAEGGSASGGKEEKEEEVKAE